MVIEESDFRLTQINESSSKWDLELIHTVRPKGKEARQEFKNAGYGLSLDSAMRRIINHRLHNKHSENAITMKDYLTEFKDQVKQLEKLLEI
jgi:hypothetical protein